MVGCEDVDLVPCVHIPVIYPNNISWSGFNCSRSRRRDVHDVVQSKLERMILEEVHDIVSVLDGGGDSVLFSPFRGRGYGIPLMLSFLHLRLELLIRVGEDGRGMRDCLGCGSNWDRCVGDGGHHCLGRVCDENPEETRSDGQSRCIFVAIFLIPSCPCCHFFSSLLGRYIGWV